MKTLLQFIKENRQEIDRLIKTQDPNQPKNNNNRRLWIMNNQVLYDYAKPHVKGI